jgi:AmmeMemoRadiSam system protein B/AmmeMemoRadiSam system protein A
VYIISIAVLVFTLFCPIILTTECRGGEVEVRKPGHAGVFYPGEKSELKEKVDAFLKEAQPKSIKGRAVLMIVPHAGYIYSGPVAAHAYRLIKDISPERIIILGPSHYYPLREPTLYGEGSFSTPLGEVPISAELIDKIKKRCPQVKISPQAHKMEHSLEVQLPFLQRSLSKFEIVPVLVPAHRASWDEKPLAKTLAELLKEDKDLILLASTDLSHFHSYNEAKRIDEDTVKLIKEMSIEKLGDGILQEKNELCGDGAVLTGMLAAREYGAKNAEVLSFASSGDTQGDKSRVVGYAAIVLYKNTPNPKEAVINKDAEKEILDIARKTIESYVREKKIPGIIPESAVFKEKRGVFVTLMKRGQLRGCIGRFQPDEDFLTVLQKMAVASATQDYRFSPVTADELKDIEIEVSVLSPLKKIESLDEFVVGKHGIYMKRGIRSSTFLPQVAPEQGWDKQDTLRHLSIKAGLGEDGWKGAEFYIYTSTIIHE